MNKLNVAVLRSVFAVLLGVALILWPDYAVTYLVIAIGVLFIIPGVLSLLAYLTRNKEEKTTSVFPIEGAGSILFGLWLVIMPQFFVNILMYILGALLVFAGVQQIVVLLKARRWSIVGWGFYVIPVLLFLTGILIITYPMGTATTTFVVFGVASIIYGLEELLNTYKFRKKEDEVTLYEP